MPGSARSHCRDCAQGKRKHSPLSPGGLIADAASDVGQVFAFTLSWQ